MTQTTCSHHWSPGASGAVTLGLVVFTPSVALAGMPSVTLTLTDLAKFRIDAISFFLVGFLASAWCVQRIWNSLAKDFVRLPWLNYRKAIGLTSLWGLLFLLVLTMISGARELMTPGAWEKRGWTYKLVNDNSSTDDSKSTLSVRREALTRLRDALWQYADAHEGRLPERSEVPDVLWRTPDPSAIEYRYFSGKVSIDGLDLVAVEPDVFRSERWGLLASGRISPVSERTIRETVAEVSGP